LEPIGVGNTATVYRAWQTRPRRVVALKVLAGGWPSEEEAQRRFQMEIEAAARQNHPHIVQVFEVGTHEGRPFFVMEYCAGGSLAQRLKNGPLPPREAAEMLEILARALNAIHAGGFIHRDLKPGNILFDLRRCPKIADFGLVKRLDAAEAGTPVGSVLGTPPYIAPEQIEGSSPADPRCDIYALGVILYECLVGRPPFQLEFTLDALFDVLTHEPPPPRLLDPRLPRDVETICLKCLEKEPGRRYQTALDLADDLRRFLSNRPIRARRVGLLGRTGRWSRRNPLSALLSATLLLTVAMGVALCGYWWYRSVENGRQTELARREAEEHFLRSRRLLPELVAAGNGPWQPIGEGRRVRREALHHACGFYRELCRAQPADGELHEELAQVLTALAQVARNMGRFEEARHHAEEAVDLWTKRMVESERNLRNRKGLAEAFHQLAAAESALGHTKETMQAYRESIALYWSLAEDYPQDETFLSMGVHARISLAYAFRGEVRFDESISQLNENRRQLQGRLINGFDAPAIRLLLVETLFRLGEHHKLRSENRAALQCWRECFSYCGGLSECFPKSPRAYYFPAACARLLPPDDPKMLKPASALAPLEQAARLLESRFVLNLDADGEWDFLSEVNLALAECYFDCGQAQEALRLERRIVDLMTEHSPAIPFQELLRLDVLVRLARREEEAGDLETARRHARAVVDDFETFCRTHAQDAAALTAALNRANTLAPTLRHAGATDLSRRLSESARKRAEQLEETNPNAVCARLLSEIWQQIAKCCMRDDPNGVEAALLQSAAAARRFAAFERENRYLLDHRLRRLARFYSEQGKHSQAAACLHECASLPIDAAK
jgi:tetratricopeptide (TPR) repeat protein